MIAKKVKKKKRLEGKEKSVLREKEKGQLAFMLGKARSRLPIILTSL